ncbi:MAG: 4Fe-4S binding protein [Planctomycetes bacterium]|nr:4Fe-4S binding protein [Planctomycetota bacterium]
MPTYGFIIDNRKCIGCHACTVACKSEHQVPLGVDRTWIKCIDLNGNLFEKVISDLEARAWQHEVKG